MTLALGIAGYSGAGKTTLIEALLPRLAARGLRVGVVKHDAHRLSLDQDGKDTARFFAAGAAIVSAHDPSQRFVRVRCAGPVPPSDVLVALPADLDFVLIEGHKDAPIPKLVLDHPEPRPPIADPKVIATLPRLPLPERLEQAEQLVADWLDDQWQQRPLGVAVLVGGQSSRMGARKAMLAYGGQSLLEHAVKQMRTVSDRIVLVGDGPAPPSLLAELPRLPDAPHLEGPMAGLLSLMRHEPERAWLAVGCDQPRFTEAHARWLIEARRPGTWALLPRIPGRTRPEPLGAIYEPPLREVLERSAAKRQLALHRAVAEAPTSTPTVPPDLAPGWLNVNTPAEWQTLTGAPPKEIDS